MIAHLAEMDTRDIHLREGYPRLYDYCREVLHLSDWEAYNRVEAARTARRFPILFDMLEDGSIHLTGVKLLAPHLTAENHRAVLESARWKSKLAIARSWRGSIRSRTCRRGSLRSRSSRSRPTRRRPQCRRPLTPPSQAPAAGPEPSHAAYRHDPRGPPP